MSLRIGFIGCVTSSAVALKTLVGSASQGREVVGIVTARSSKYNSDFYDMRPLADKHGIPFIAEDDFTNPSRIAEWLRPLRPDVVFCVGWSRLLSGDVLQVAPLGVIGYHPAALPANRGRHPLIWALALGLSETASSFFLMDEAADSGNLIDQTPISIDYNDDAASLYLKVLNEIPAQVERIVNALESGKLHSVVQDHARSNTWRKRSAVDGRIDWRMPAEGVRNLVRALARPYPGAEFSVSGKIVKLWKCMVVPSSGNNHEPGKVLDVAGRHIIVKCGVDAVCLIEHDLPLLPEKGSYL